MREITGRCQSTLIKIFKVFQDIDDILYVEVKRHIRENEGRYFEPPSLAPRVRLTKTDLAVVGEGKWHGSDPPTGFALGRLGDVSCILVWRKILDTLIEYQEKESWMLAKQRALDILQARDRIAPLFDDIQEELINELCESLHQKLNLLERFTAVYNAQRTSSIENDRPAWEPAYNTYDVPDLQKSRFVANAYPHLQPQVYLYPTSRNAHKLISIIAKAQCDLDCRCLSRNSSV